MAAELKQSPTSRYFAHSFNLTDNQIRSIVLAIQSKEPIVLKLSKKIFDNGNTVLPLTKAEGLNVIKNKSFHYNLSKNKIKLFKLQEQKEGGLLPLIPLILGGISALGALTGGASAIAKTVIDKKANDARLEEQIRHDKEIENNLKEGNCIKEVSSNGLFLQPYKGECIKSFVNSSKLDASGKKCLRCFLKNLSSHMRIEKQGDGLYISNL